MNLKTYIAIFALVIFTLLLKAEGIKTGKTFFEDNFESLKIKENWLIEEGEWKINNGWLFNQNGGIISLKRPCGESFVLEADIRIAQFKASYPWVSVVFSYADKNNRTELFITPGEEYYYIQAFENAVPIRIIGGRIPFDSKESHKLQIVCFYKTISLFWDGKFISSAKINSLESKIAFIGNSQGADFEIKNIRIKEFLVEPAKVVKNIKAEDFSKGKIWNDYKFKCETGNGKELSIGASNVFLSYDFSDSTDFRSTFLNLPVNVESARRICLNIEGDNSQNRFFIIIHDKSGEQHLVEGRSISWNGPHEIKVDIECFFKAPPERVIEATHWDGDKNQKINFPITALDIGVCKREKALKQSGRIGISNLRFEE